LGYPYSNSILPLLKIVTTTDHYRIVRAKGRHYRFNHVEEHAWKNYISIIPTYKYAQCPICDTDCIDYIDTYMLRPTMRYELGHHSIYSPLRMKGAPCEHYAGVQSFINYHGHFPYEISRIRGYSEVPYVGKQIIDHDGAHAVMHALPVCRIEDNQFIPRYTLFLVTYFALDIGAVYAAHYAQEYEFGGKDPEFFPHNLVATNREYNLIHLAKMGKLGWLDFNSKDLRLIIGEGSTLPEIYQDIPGRKSNYDRRRNGIVHKLHKLKETIRSIIHNDK